MAGSPSVAPDLGAGSPVLDSDVLIDYLRGAGSGRQVVVALRDSLDYRVTAVTAFELALGRSFARDPAPVRALLAVTCLPLDLGAALRAGDLQRDLGARGLETRDALQAGICLEAGAMLLTRNVRHFERVDGLDVIHPEDWLSKRR